MSKQSIRRSIANKNIIVCDQCENEIKEESDNYIQCDKCKKTYHSQCSGLSRREFERLVKNKKELFNCQFCKEDDNNVRQELNIIKTELRKLNKLEKLDELTESINFMSAKFDEVFKDVAENKRKINEIENENKKLKTEIKSLKFSVKILNEHRLKNDCVISGLKVTDEKMSAFETIAKISENIGVKIDNNTVEDAYFLKNKNKNNENKTVVVKFTSKMQKDKFMSSKAKLKENEDTKKIYINNFNSKETMHLYNYAKSLKSIGYQYVFIKNGRVFAKRSDTSNQQLIREEDEVDKILLNATSNKQWGRRSLIHPRQVEAEDFSDVDGEDGAPYMSPS